MISNRDEWNNVFKELKLFIKNPKENLSIIIELSSALHCYTHESAEMNKSITLEDEVWQMSGNFTSFSEKKLYSAAWHIWHSARIEDISCSQFICQKKEIIDELEFVKRLRIPFRHTGNSMSFPEMQEFNDGIDLQELRYYRNEVGKRTQDCMKFLTSGKLQEKVKSESLSNIQKTASITNNDVWLLDYWGKKNISGIILMPLTRHLLVHLNSAMRIL